MIRIRVNAIIIDPKTKQMIVVLGAVVVWLVSSKLRDDSRAQGIDPRINGLDGPLMERVQTMLLHLLV